MKHAKKIIISIFLTMKITIHDTHSNDLSVGEIDIMCVLNKRNKVYTNQRK